LGEATAVLGFTDVRATIRETQIGSSYEPMARVLTLDAPNGKRVVVTMRDSSDGNHGASLYEAANDHYIFLSRSDCFEVDPFAMAATSCRIEAPVEPANGRETDQRCLAEEHPRGILRHPDVGYRPIYLGRFDWMNGYDPPDGRFGLGFRYLHFADAGEGSGYCEWSRAPR
jgi:hypothetical protein